MGLTRNFFSGVWVKWYSECNNFNLQSFNFNFSSLAPFPILFKSCASPWPCQRGKITGGNRRQEVTLTVSDLGSNDFCYTLKIFPGSRRGRSVRSRRNISRFKFWAPTGSFTGLESIQEVLGQNRQTHIRRGVCGRHMDLCGFAGVRRRSS